MSYAKGLTAKLCAFDVRLLIRCWLNRGAGAAAITRMCMRPVDVKRTRKQPVSQSQVIVWTLNIIVWLTHAHLIRSVTSTSCKRYAAAALTFKIVVRVALWTTNA